MELNDHSLRQMDEDAIRKLPEPAVRDLAVRLLNDLKEARERLNQNSRNSSRPPGSDAPWEKVGEDCESDGDDTEGAEWEEDKDDSKACEAATADGAAPSEVGSPERRYARHIGPAASQAETRQTTGCAGFRTAAAIIGDGLRRSPTDGLSRLLYSTRSRGVGQPRLYRFLYTRY